MPALINSPGLPRLQRIFRRYSELRKRTLNECIVHKAKSAVIEFYKAAKAIAPTPGKIKADVTSRGWRVKRKPGAWPRKPGEKRGSRGPLRRMQAAQTKRRQRAIGSVASGYIPAMKGLGVKPGAGADKFRRPKGKLDVVGQGTSTPAIAVTNSTPGIAAVEKKHQIIRQGLNAVAKDTLEYIRRKQEETARELRN